MKYIPSIVFAAMLLCYPALRAHAELTPEDVKLLQACKVSQEDIDVITQLPTAGQDNLDAVFTSRKADKCQMPAIKNFIATRDYLRKFRPPPQSSPMPPVGYDRNYLTPNEQAYVTNTNKSIMDKVIGWFTGS
jgi:hypothetical protein